MGESRNKNSYNIGYFLEFQWQKSVILSARILGMGDIEYFVLVLQATMADFNKTAGMTLVIIAVDGLLIPIKASHDQEHLYVCHINVSCHEHHGSVQCTTFIHQLCK